MDCRPDAPGSRHQQVLALLREAGAAMDGLGARYAAAAGVHPTDLHALELLSRSGTEPMTVGRLGTALELSSGAVTGLVDRLVRAGHVERVGDLADRRRVHLRISRSAMDLAEDYFGSYGQRLRQALDGFSDDELDTVAAFLRAARDAAAPPA